MSARTITVQPDVYRRLKAVKRERESFSRVIDRLIRDAGSSASGDSILDQLDTVCSLSRDEAQVLFQVVKESRLQERWHSRA